MVRYGGRRLLEQQMCPLNSNETEKYLKEHSILKKKSKSMYLDRYDTVFIIMVHHEGEAKTPEKTNGTAKL